MKECAKVCFEEKKCCRNRSCRMWIKYKEDYNCTLISVEKNENGLTLEKCAERLKLSIATVKNLQESAIRKMTEKLVQNENF